MAFFYAPQLTLPKVLLAMNTPASRQQAAAALARLHAFVTEIHNTRFTIEVLAMQALLHHVEENEPATLQALEQAVALAWPGGSVRVSWTWVLPLLVRWNNWPCEASLRAMSSRSYTPSLLAALGTFQSLHDLVFIPATLTVNSVWLLR